MNFQKIDRHHVKSECGMYVINKATVGRDRTQCYMAVHRGHTILGTWRCADEPGDRAAAYNEAVRACVEHAAEANK